MPTVIMQICKCQYIYYMSAKANMPLAELGEKVNLKVLLE